MSKLRSRQVHLDFHTSEHIPGVGRKFDRRQWQKALKLGRVNSITVFAKCHHSWCYYPTKIGRVHPTLKRNLLGEQIAACHEIGVRAPIYFTVGWSATDAERHPEWCVRNPDRSIHTTQWDPNARAHDPRPICSWKFLCPSGRYLKLILDQTHEICERFEVDGFFYDITNGPVCYCSTCRAAMEAAGLDPGSEAQARRHNLGKWHHLMDECNRIIREAHPAATVYFNGTTNIYEPWMHGRMTHLELEDLPTTWGGYDKFPLRSRYFANDGRDYLAMSGKFHTMWGEFGGFKHPDAIRFEAAAMIAYGSRCSFGDQLHPSGEMDVATYRSIGEAYRYVEKIEAYGLDGTPASNLGVWLSGGGTDLPHGSSPPDQGIVNMLLESQMDFRVVDPKGDLSGLDAIILTGDARLGKKTAAKLKEFVASGGGLLVLGTSGLDPGGKRFLIDVGARHVGPARYRDDYLVVTGKLGRGLVESPFLCYSAAERVRATSGQVLAAIREPYFDRTYGKYCSHQNTPYQWKDASHPGAVRKGRVVYLPHPLGEMYYHHGARVHRDFFINALKLVYSKPVLSVRMPSAARATILHQPESKRYVAHLLYGPPMQRGRCLVIEDLVPLRDVAVELRVRERIRKAHLIPGKKPVTLKRSAGAVKLTVPEVACHQAVVFEY